MKTLETVLSEQPADRQFLIDAVIEATGGEEVTEDVNRGGADAGWPGFTYYADTVNFFTGHRADIVKMAEETSDECGWSAVEMIANFGCLKGLDISRNDIARVLYSGVGEGDDDAQIANALAWFALETVCRMFED